MKSHYYILIHYLIIAQVILSKMGKAMILEISSKTKPTTYHMLFITNQIGVHKELDPIVLSELDSQFENNLFVYVFERVGKFQGKLNVLLHQALELNTVESSYFFYPLLLYELLYTATRK